MHNALLRSLIIALIVIFPASYLSAPPANAKTESASFSKKSIKKAVKKPVVKRKVVRRGKPIDLTPDPNKFAALVVDASNGRVIYAKNANAIRHPASLTKMMTLYLTFDALKKRSITLNTMWTASEKAASAAPTNISLDAGDRIPVETAIEALIIRSANDVAMVAAENLGGTEWDFALMMNRKARELGMKNTVFYNPSGLPDGRQVTSATDMAKLGIALRRDFPEYYHYFKDRSFSYGGRTYEGHNRLLGRYPGADGIKTGYVNASGFNLVTSVKRANTRLVGVILGGRTGASRDQLMMQMLDDAFLEMARKNPKNAELVQPHDPIEDEDEVADAQATNTNATSAPMTDEAAAEAPTAPPAPVASAPTQPPFEVKPASPDTTPAPAAVAAKPITPEALDGEKNWGIQVGAYPTKAQAEKSAKAVKDAAGSLVAQSVIVTPSYHDGKRQFYRARLMGLTGPQARTACRGLISQGSPCLTVRIDKI